MKSNKKRILYSNSRTIISDTLPFEIPVTFSNKDYYKFLTNHNVHYKDGKIVWKKNSSIAEMSLRFLLGIEKDVKPKKTIISESGRKTTYHYFEFNNFYSKPFSFKISHKENEFRELSIPHPKTQFRVSEFYNEYKESILYFTNRSPISLRMPFKESSHVYHSDKLHIDRFDRTESEIEEFEKEYENLKSFFVYKNYSNIYKYYESYKFHRCEKKYNNLLKLDISKCFDSIYSHSITWAVYGKEKVKRIFLDNKIEGKLNDTFSDKFDCIMQMANGRETNGIIIGPEFSRVFAEIILQNIDLNLLGEIENNYKNIEHKKDFEIYRYMDDYFLFYNVEDTKKAVMNELQKELKEYKLHLNSSKAVLYEKPIITEITIAKEKISTFLDSKLRYVIEETEPGILEGNISINSRRMITEFKIIIKESKVSYKDILNWTLSIIEIRLDKIFRDYLRLSDFKKKEKQISSFILNLIEFLFFSYSVTPRVNTTLRLCRVITKTELFLTRHSNDMEFLQSFHRLVFENILFLLSKFRHQKITQVETLYLLVQLTQFGDNYKLSEDQLCDFISIDLTDSNIEDCFHLNHLTLTVLLFYIKNDPRYKNLKIFIQNLVCKKLISSPNDTWWDAELNLLLLDSLYCPYISTATKRKILVSQGYSSSTLLKTIVNSKLNWFTTWNNFEFGKALDAKRSLEVY